MRYSLRGLLTFIGICAVALALIILGYRMVTDDKEFLLVKTGMTQSQVQSILGAPHHIKKGGDWYYDLHSPGGPIAVMFDEHGRVVDLDWSPGYE